ncbi:MAG: T9SS type A sorting domain-containing protein [Chthoniobacterales bacterium]
MSVSLVLAPMAYGTVPTLNVMVSDASGKLAFKGATKNDGGFTTEKLQPGNYVVQLSSKNSALKGGEYSIIVAAGKKKVVANSVAGERFLGGGVAMKVDVGAGLGIFGCVSAGSLPTDTAQRDSVRKMQDRAADTHQPGLQQGTGNVQDKMIRP